MLRIPQEMKVIHPPNYKARLSVEKEDYTYICVLQGPNSQHLMPASKHRIHTDDDPIGGNDDYLFQKNRGYDIVFALKIVKDK